MTQAKARPARYADLEALPPNVVGEILFGVLHAHPRPTPRHAKVSTELSGELLLPFGRGRGGPGGWVLLIEPELHLGPHVVVPDVAGWRRERLPSAPDTAWIGTPPDWVCEVLSPATQRYDRTDKLEIYAGFDVPYCWLIDPLLRTLEALVLASGKWSIAATLKDDDAVCTPPFEAHTFPLDVLWFRDENEPAT